jgi:hypothetical protein
MYRYLKVKRCEKIFVSEGDTVSRQRGVLYDLELCGVHRSTSLLSKENSRWLCRAERIAHMGTQIMHVEIW